MISLTSESVPLDDTEAMLLIDNNEGQIVEYYTFLNQRVGSDGDLCFPAFYSPLYLLLFLSIPVLSSVQQLPDPEYTARVKPGLCAEFFNLTLEWDEGDYTSRLKSYLFSTNTKFEITDGLSFNLILGYSLSNFNGLTFRQLPFSIEIGVGEIGGVLFGAEVNKRLLYLSDYEIILHGNFVYYYGFKNEWEVPTLNVQGTVIGTPSWMRGQIGPTVRYEGLNIFSPFVSFKYGKLWGHFNLSQEIQELSGTENKKIDTLGHFILTVGTEIEITADLLVIGEATLVPYNGGLDFGGKVLLRYAFQTGRRRIP